VTPDEAAREASRLGAMAGRSVIIADTQDNAGVGGDAEICLHSATWIDQHLVERSNEHTFEWCGYALDREI
jgi:microcystin degradation protein MlrC